LPSLVSATLTDIARATRTSVSTVSRVLAGGAVSKRISSRTRERVSDAARKLGYRPNLLARSLRTRKSNTVALLVSDIANPWFGQIASLVEQSLHREGYSLVLCNSGEDRDREREYLQLLPQKGIDGLIVVPVLHSKQELLRYLPRNLPLVILDRPIPGIPASVCSDETQLASALCDTLEGAGVKKVAVVRGPRHISTHRTRHKLIARRFDIVALHSGPAQARTGREAFIKLLGLGESEDQPEPDAIVCTNNFLGQGVIDSIAEIDKPPIIACWDDVAMMHLSTLPVVTVVQDVPTLAAGCVSQLLPQLWGEVVEINPIVLPGRVITNRAFQQRESAR
jgi:LacI family transcriptional regulator